MSEKTSKKETADKAETQKPRCGIIMPISEIDGCSVEHWADVKDVLLEVIGQTEFEGDLVSNAGEIRIIHETIVQNIYNNEMIICDVSGKNPNVMFELGLRLAFDKPAIIIKDDVTNYSFDTSPIEHLEYPRDLNYKKINDFKILLRDKLTATYKKADSDKNYSPFLKSFGQFRVAKIETKEVSSDQFIINELQNIRKAITELSQPARTTASRIAQLQNKDQNLNTQLIKGMSFSTDTEKSANDLVAEVKENYNIASTTTPVLDGTVFLEFSFFNPVYYPELKSYMDYLARHYSIQGLVFIRSEGLPILVSLIDT